MKTAASHASLPAEEAHVAAGGLTQQAQQLQQAQQVQQQHMWGVPRHTVHASSAAASTEQAGFDGDAGESAQAQAGMAAPLGRPPRPPTTLPEPAPPPTGSGSKSGASKKKKKKERQRAAAAAKLLGAGGGSGDESAADTDTSFADSGGCVGGFYCCAVMLHALQCNSVAGCAAGQRACMCKIFVAIASHARILLSLTPPLPNLRCPATRPPLAAAPSSLASSPGMTSFLSNIAASGGTGGSRLAGAPGGPAHAACEAPAPPSGYSSDNGSYPSDFLAGRERRMECGSAFDGEC